jgi:carboxyl-terminal processing protease
MRSTMRRATCIGFGLLTCGAFAQSFRNLDFAQRCDTCKTKLVAWDESWASGGVTCTQRNDATGDPALVIASAKDGVGFVEQNAAVKAEAPRILTISARVRSVDIIGRGAGLNVGILDADGAQLGNKDMGFGSFSWMTGTTPWHTISLKLLCPKEVARVKLGAILYGQGEAWFDDFAVSAMPLDARTSDARAEAYITVACDTIARHSLRRDSVDLDALRLTALQVAGSEGDPRDLHLAVEYLLNGLGDHHSFLMKPEEVKAWQGNGPPPAIEYPTHRVIEGCGYVDVRKFDSSDSLVMLAFADTIQQALARCEAQGVHGWIVDLRNNMGGNMAPMVCGLGPLFDAGTLGQLIDIDGKARHWYYRDGRYGWDETVEMLPPRPVTLKKHLPIAVLWGPGTGSSGECVAISFIGNSGTRSFGAPTWGLTTGNDEFDLPDGAKIFLASTVMADRHGHAFHGPVPPDQVVQQEANRKDDAVLKAALDWIKAQR